MPIQSCKLPNGKQGYKWGKSGKCYASRASAEKQARAAYASGYGKSGRDSKRNKKASTI
jgi:hypothetical protein